MKPQAIIFDVDSTLVDVSPLHDLALASVETQDFDEYHIRATRMMPNFWVVEAAQEASEAGFKILIVTARQEKYRNLTEFWLTRWGVPFELVAMRKNGDLREDAEVKEDMYRGLVQDYIILKAYEDRESVAALWKRKGLAVVMVP